MYVCMNPRDVKHPGWLPQEPQWGRNVLGPDVLWRVKGRIFEEPIRISRYVDKTFDFDHFGGVCGIFLGLNGIFKRVAVAPLSIYWSMPWSKKCPHFCPTHILHSAPYTSSWRPTTRWLRRCTNHCSCWLSCFQIACVLRPKVISSKFRLLFVPFFCPRFFVDTYEI